MPRPKELERNVKNEKAILLRLQPAISQ